MLNKADAGSKGMDLIFVFQKVLDQYYSVGHPSQSREHLREERVIFWEKTLILAHSHSVMKVTYSKGGFIPHLISPNEFQPWHFYVVLENHLSETMESSFQSLLIIMSWMDQCADSVS